MANFYTDHPEIKFNLESNSLMPRIVELKEKGYADKDAFDYAPEDFADAMDNDLNTAQAVTVIYDVLKSKANAAAKIKLLNEFDTVLGLDLVPNAEKLAADNASAGADIPAEVLELVEQRKAARKDKNFALADELRDKIAALGYSVKETRQGTEITKL